MATNTQTIIWLEELSTIMKDMAKKQDRLKFLRKKLSFHIRRQKQQQSNIKYRDEE